MSLDIAHLFAEREQERYGLHTRYLNEQMVRLLRTIGFDRAYQRGRGQYLFDRHGQQYLDLLSGWGVFAIGRNHPAVRDTLKKLLDGDFPNLVQLDVSALAGVLAERLLRHVPYLEKVFFANSGTESVEAALKFARAATGRAGVVYCSHAFHGLTYGALSVNGDAIFRSGFGPLLPECNEIPFGDLDALERALSSRRAAAFIVEPIQGKGVIIPPDEYLPDALALCRKHGTLFIADEIQTGLGRTGRFLASAHWGIEPDMVLLAKSLSGGHVPVGAVLTRKWIFDKVFDRIDRAVVHGSTFAKNDMAMAAGLATLEVIESERLMENAGRTHAGGVRSHGEALRAHQSRAGKGADAGHRIRRAALAEAQDILEFARNGEQRAVLPAHRDPAAEGAQDPQPGCRTRQSHDKALAVADHLRCGLRLDRAGV
jgi:ornithine--oxo-acid transaminase